MAKQLEVPVEKLRKLRKHFGYTLADVAAACNVSDGMLSRIELGKCDSPNVIDIYTRIILNSYAYKKGYIPCYRRMGTNDFVTPEKMAYMASKEYISEENNE